MELPASDDFLLKRVVEETKRMVAEMQARDPNFDLKIDHMLAFLIGEVAMLRLQARGLERMALAEGTLNALMNVVAFVTWIKALTQEPEEPT